MKKIKLWLAVSLIVILLTGGILTTQVTASDRIVLQDSNQMIVIYQKSDQQYMLSLRGPAVFVDDNIALYLVINQYWKRRVTNLDKMAYLICPYQKIERQYDDEGFDVPIYMYDLNLHSYDTADLPHSQHIAKLVDVNPDAKKPATVARKYLGSIYYENCLVSMPAKEAYQAGTLQVGDYVVITYIDEIPDDNEINVCVLEYGIWESW